MIGDEGSCVSNPGRNVWDPMRSPRPLLSTLLFQIPEGTFGTVPAVIEAVEEYAFQIPEGTFGTSFIAPPSTATRGCFKSRKERLGPFRGCPRCGLSGSRFKSRKERLGPAEPGRAVLSTKAFQIPEGTFGTASPTTWKGFTPSSFKSRKERLGPGPGGPGRVVGPPFKSRKERLGPP